MADIESNIRINIDTSEALASIKSLQAQISAFHIAMRKGNAQNAATSAALQQQLISGINSTGKFAASIKTIKTTAESFTTALEKNKLTMGEYFRYAGGASKTFGKLFKSEFETMNKVARERVKDLQTQYIKLGRDANGAMKAIKVRPLVLDMENLATKTAIAAQKQQLLNQLLKQGSTNLLNFGKNTQWAGRQLMVGFTVPLTMFAGAAIKSFAQIEQALVKIKRVYGDMATTSEETNQMAKDLQKLAESYTKYGMAVADTLDMAATAAATGKTGIELLKQVDAAAKLAALGGIDQAKALETTISLTNTFSVASEELSGKIDFLNAVENQTILNIGDLTEAIPKAAPVIKQLGGNVEDLAFFMTAMREGGISASQGANALKSGMAAIINPTQKATDLFASFGIGIKEIVERDKGDIKQTFLDMAAALDKLDPLNRARAIETLFGKFQFARMSTLFKNIADQNSQASKVLALSRETPQELAILSRRELAKTSQSPLYQFQKAMQDFKTSLAPLGVEFIKVFKPIITGITDFLKKFNEMGPGAKSFIVGLISIVAGLGPVLLMTFGLMANGFANIIKGFVAMKNFFNSTGKSSKTLGEQTKYMTQEQIEAAAVAASLDQVHGKLTQTFTAEREALQLLIAEYQRAVAAQSAVTGGSAIPSRLGAKRYASGVVSVPGPKGAGDVVPAMLSPGEAVIPTKMASKYAPLIHGMVNDNLPGYAVGTVGIGMTALTERQIEGRLRSLQRLEEISESIAKTEFANAPVTTYGRQIQQSTGHSFKPGWGIGGVYEKADGTTVFVKPVLSVEEAKAEARATQIAREVHGLEAPTQKVVIMRDPTDETGRRRLPALESAYNKNITKIPETFNKNEFAKQLVASLLRGDKDLGIGNLGGNILADVGTAGIFEKASGGKAGLARKIALAMPSMESQAMINLLGVKGGAKKWFAQATSGFARGMTPAQYHNLIANEIDRILPRLKKTIDSFKNLTLEEKQAYSHMIQRLEEGKKVDWSKFQSVHAAVPGFANGVVSVPGPKGAGDIMPAMLSPGESVIPAKMSKKYAPLIGAMVTDSVPGFEFSNVPQSQAQTLSKYFFNWEGSHASQLNQHNMPGFIGRAIAANPELAKLRVEVRELVYVMDDLGKVVPSVVKKMVSLDKLPQYREVLTAGGGYGFAAKAELHSVNQAYTQIPYTGPGNVAGKVPGFALTSDERVAFGKAAEEALIAHKNGALKLTKEYIPAIEALARQGREEAAILADVSRADVRRKEVLLENVKALSMQGRMVLADGSVLEKSTASKAQMAAIETQVSMDLVEVERAMVLAEQRGLRGQEVVNAGLAKYAEILAVSTPGFTVTNSQGVTGQNILLRDINKNTAVEATAANIAHEEAKASMGKKNSNYRTLVRRMWTRQGPEDYLGFRGGKQSKDLVAATSGSGRNIGLSLPKEILAQIQSIGTQAGQGLINGLKKVLQISSPSRKLFQIGQQAAQGMMNGVRDKFNQAKAVGQELAQAEISGLASRAGMAAGAGGMVARDPFAFGDETMVPVAPPPLTGKEKFRVGAGIAGRLGMSAARGGGRLIARGARGGYNAAMNYAARRFDEKQRSLMLNQQARARIAEHEAATQAALAAGQEPPLPLVLTPEEKEAMRRNPTKQERKQVRAQKRQARRALGGRLMGAGMAVSTAAMMGGMMPGEIGKKMQELMMPIMAFSMILPMLTSPIGLVVVALGALALAIYTVNAAQDEAQKKAIENAEAFEGSTKAITKLSEFAGTVTASEYMNEVRKTQFAMLGFASGKKTFGESFAGTQQGKSLSKNIAELSGKGNNQEAVSQLYGQLSTSVMSGALSMAQAKSIAMNVAQKAGNISVGIEVVGKMNSLLGPNGEDLTKKPLQVRMNMVAESQKQLKAGFQNNTPLIQQTYGQRNAEMGKRLGLGGLAAIGGAGLVAGGGILAGMAAGATIGSSVPVFGTILGAVAGLAVGAYFAWQTAKDAAEKAGKLTGATIADAKIALEQNKQMIDSLDVYYEKKIKQLKAQGKINEATALENKYLKERETLVDAQAKTMGLIIDQVNEAEKTASEVADAYISGAEKALGMAYKGDTNQTLYIDAVKASLNQLRQENFIDKGIQTSFLLKMASKDILPSQMSSLLSFMASGQKQSTIGVNIVSKFTGPTSAQAAEVLGLLANTAKVGAFEQMTFMAQVSAQPTDQDAQSLINAMGQMTTAESIIPARIGIEFYLKNKNALGKYEGMLSKISPDGVKDISAFYNIIPKIDTNKTQTLTPEEETMFKNLKNPKEKAVFTTVMAMEMNISMDAIVNSDDFKTWQQEGGKLGGAQYSGKSLIFQVARYRALQSFQAVEEAGSFSVGAGGGGGDKGKPDASFLDEVVKRIRDVSNATQGLTTGFTASYNALQRFMKSGSVGFNGVASQLYKLGAGPNLISAILGASEKDVAALFDKKGNLILDKAKNVINDFNTFMEENSDEAIALKWMQLSVTEKLQEQANMYQAGLEVLSGKEKQINDRYDDRLKALDEIQKINSEINQQESSKLDIADALSKGDIAAAARAAQKAKADNANAAIQATKDSLEKARKQEIDDLEVIINGKVWHRRDLELEIESITARVNQLKLDQIVHEINIGKELDRNIGKQKRFNNLVSLSSGSGSSTSQPTDETPEPHFEGEDAGDGMKWSKKSGKWTKVDKYKEGQNAGAGTGKIWSKKSGKWQKIWDPGGSNAAIQSFEQALNLSINQGLDEETLSMKRNLLMGELPGKIRVAFNWIKQAKSLWDEDKNFLQQYKDSYYNMSGNKPLDEVATNLRTPELVNAWQIYQNQIYKMRARRKFYVGFRNDLLNYRDKSWWTEKGFLADSDDFFTNPAADNVIDLNHYASGGYISGKGTGTSDDIPAMLSNGEYVIRANAVKTIGTDALDRLNQADRTKFANGGMVMGYDEGGYIGPRPAPQWDDKGRWVVSRGESYWSTAEETLPAQMDIGSWWSRILKSNIDPTTGKERRLYRNSRIWIPGRLEPYPPKSGIPRIFKKINKTPFGMEFKISESHAGQGGGGIGGGLFGFGPRMYALGGYVNGGKASRYGLGTDNIPAMLSEGEYVIRKSAVDAIGTSTLDSINNGESMGDSVYNYNVTLNVSSSSNASEIADRVLGEIKRLDSQRIRGNRV